MPGDRLLKAMQLLSTWNEFLKMCYVICKEKGKNQSCAQVRASKNCEMKAIAFRSHTITMQVRLFTDL